MNKQLFTDLCDLLATLEGLRWVDWDDGQLDTLDARQPIALPSCMVDINLPACDMVDDTTQIVTGTVTLRFVFARTGATNHLSPVRADALETFDLMQAAHVLLQGWTNNYTHSPLQRTRAEREKRRDGLKVYRVTYSTTWYDMTE